MPGSATQVVFALLLHPFLTKESHHHQVQGVRECKLTAVCIVRSQGVVSLRDREKVRVPLHASPSARSTNSDALEDRCDRISSNVTHSFRRPRPSASQSPATGIIASFSSCPRRFFFVPDRQSLVVCSFGSCGSELGWDLRASECASCIVPPTTSVHQAGPRMV